MHTGELNKVREHTCLGISFAGAEVPSEGSLGRGSISSLEPTSNAVWEMPDGRLELVPALPIGIVVEAVPPPDCEATR